MRILIVEDDVITAEDIADLLEEAGFQISGIAYHGKEALNELENNTPDLVLLDIHLNQGLTGIQLAHIINKKYQLPFLYLTAFSDQKTVNQVKTTHPMGYLVKPFDEKSLITTIEIAYYNYAQLWKNRRPDLTKPLINQQIHTPLTSREFCILQLLLEGMTNKQIAEELCVSTNTVKTHLSNIYLKLEVNSRSKIFTRMNTLLRKAS